MQRHFFLNALYVPGVLIVLDAYLFAPFFGGCARRWISGEDRRRRGLSFGRLFVVVVVISLFGRLPIQLNIYQYNNRSNNNNNTCLSCIDRISAKA